MTASMNVDDDGARRRRVDRPVEPDDAAERREAVGSRARTYACVDGRADRRAARVGVLDDHRGRLVELEHDARGRIEIEQIGVRQLLALKHVGGAEAGRPGRAAYQAAGWCGFSP